jgi:hypothetical protein
MTEDDRVQDSTDLPIVHWTTAKIVATMHGGHKRSGPGVEYIQKWDIAEYK